jgi:hypothetical protein
MWCLTVIPGTDDDPEFQSFWQTRFRGQGGRGDVAGGRLGQQWAPPRHTVPSGVLARPPSELHATPYGTKMATMAKGWP